MNKATSVFRSSDGLDLAYHVMGAEDARPVVLVHGLFSNAETNWIRFGHAEAIAKRGFRLIMPDLRAHGESPSPHEALHYPPDILVDDLEGLIAHLGLTDYDLGGYSLGARTAARAVVRGAAPRRLVIAGMGLKGMEAAYRGADHFREVLRGLGTHEQGSAKWLAEAFLKTTGGDPEALLPLLDSFVDTTRDELKRIEVETLVLSGTEDRDNGSMEELAHILPNARMAEVPGNHMGAVTKAELGEAMADFLAS